MHTNNFCLLVDAAHQIQFTLIYKYDDGIVWLWNFINKIKQPCNNRTRQNSLTHSPKSITCSACKHTLSAKIVCGMKWCCDALFFELFSSHFVCYEFDGIVYKCLCGCQLNSIILFGLLNIQLDASKYISMKLKWNKITMKIVWFRFMISFIPKVCIEITLMIWSSLSLNSNELLWVQNGESLSRNWDDSSTAY